MAIPDTDRTRSGSASPPKFLVTVSLLGYDAQAVESVAFFYDADTDAGVAQRVFMTLGLGLLDWRSIYPKRRDEHSAAFMVFGLIREFDVEVQVFDNMRLRHLAFEDLLPTIQAFDLPCFLRDRMPRTHDLRSPQLKAEVLA